MSNSYVTNEGNNYNSVKDFYIKKSVFITGGTGFVGKVLIERLLHNCHDLEKIYVLVRNKKKDNASQRIKKLIDNPLYAKLREERPLVLQKIVLIVGDLLADNLGISVEDEQTLIREVCIYISTAYANWKDAVLEERLYPLPISIDEVYKFMVRHGDDESQISKIMCGAPNTYTFSKALTECLIAENQKDVPCIIIRPSIVSAIKNEPLNGWLENWQGATSLLTGSAKGLLRVVIGNNDTILDLIPVDYICNLSIVAAAKYISSKEVTVYNLCTSSVNPICLRKCTDLFLIENIKHTSDTLLSRTIFTRRKYLLFTLSLLLESGPLYFLDVMRILTGKQPRYVKNMSRIFAARDLLEYYMVHSWVRQIPRSQELISSLSPEDRQLFPCDPTDINWEEYIPNYFLGIERYLLKNKL